MKAGYEPKNLLGEMGQICEEAGEVLKHFGKILRFGLDKEWPSGGGGESNRDAFYRELDDLEACIKRIKARRAKDPHEKLGVVDVEHHKALADAAQETLVILEKVGISGSAVTVGPGIEGVYRRGRLRAALVNLGARVGAALARSSS